MKTIQLAALSCMAAASTAAAQPIWYSMVAWEVSQDDGQTWQGGTVEVADPFARLRIRALGDWFVTDGYAFADVAMDVTITYGVGVEINDSVVGAAPIAPFDSLPGQTYVATRFGNVLKIDEIRDTLPPGFGPQWVVPQQPPENFSESFSTAQPAPLFQFSLELDGTPGARIVDHVYPRHVGSGDELGPRIYISPDGRIAWPRDVRRGPLNLVVIPSPGALALGLLAFPPRRRWACRAAAPPERSRGRISEP